MINIGYNSKCNGSGMNQELQNTFESWFMMVWFMAWIVANKKTYCKEFLLLSSGKTRPEILGENWRCIHLTGFPRGRCYYEREGV